MTLFTANLTDKESWLTERETAGHALIKYVAKKEHLSGNGHRISPSTNLIYCFGDQILKVFAPAVCGYQALEDFNREIFGLVQLQNTCLCVPQIISSGCVHDQYDFYYLVIQRLDIPPASEFINTCTSHQLSRLGGALLEGIALFKNICADTNLAKMRNSRSLLWQEREAWLEAEGAVRSPQFVHADLSGSNVLYDGRHLAMIDFEDWTYSTPAVEYPEIVFDLLQGRKAYIEAFFSRPLSIALIDEIFNGLLHHYNWERFLHRYCACGNRPPASLAEARAWFHANINR